MEERKENRHVRQIHSLYGTSGTCIESVVSDNRVMNESEDLLNQKDNCGKMGSKFMPNRTRDTYITTKCSIGKDEGKGHF